jgi:hypothetical protein
LHHSEDDDEEDDDDDYGTPTSDMSHLEHDADQDEDGTPSAAGHPMAVSPSRMMAAPAAASAPPFRMLPEVRVALDQLRLLMLSGEAGGTRELPPDRIVAFINNVGRRLPLRVSGASHRRLTLSASRGWQDSMLEAAAAETGADPVEATALLHALPTDMKLTIEPGFVTVSIGGLRTRRLPVPSETDRFAALVEQMDPLADDNFQDANLVSEEVAAALFAQSRSMPTPPATPQQRPRWQHNAAAIAPPPTASAATAAALFHQHRKLPHSPEHDAGSRAAAGKTTGHSGADPEDDRDIDEIMSGRAGRLRGMEHELGDDEDEDEDEDGEYDDDDDDDDAYGVGVGASAGVGAGYRGPYANADEIVAGLDRFSLLSQPAYALPRGVATTDATLRPSSSNDSLQEYGYAHARSPGSIQGQGQGQRPSMYVSAPSPVAVPSSATGPSRLHQAGQYSQPHQGSPSRYQYPGLAGSPPSAFDQMPSQDGSHYSYAHPNVYMQQQHGTGQHLEEPKRTGRRQRSPRARARRRQRKLLALQRRHALQQHDAAVAAGITPSISREELETMFAPPPPLGPAQSPPMRRRNLPLTPSQQRSQSPSSHLQQQQAPHLGRAPGQPMSPQQPRRSMNSGSSGMYADLSASPSSGLHHHHFAAGAGQASSPAALMYMGPPGIYSGAGHPTMGSPPTMRRSMAGASPPPPLPPGLAVGSPPRNIALGQAPPHSSSHLYFVSQASGLTTFSLNLPPNNPAMHATSSWGNASSTGPSTVPSTTTTSSSTPWSTGTR